MLYDLHIHSCMSPCGDDDMTPNNIAGMAHIAGLGVIAVTDHNGTRNIPAVKECARQYGVKVLPGVEVNTAEDIHLLCYFEDVDSCLSFEEQIYARLPPVTNKPEIYGNQYIMNTDDEITQTVDKLLIMGSLSLWDCVDLCHSMGGKAIYAHIDKNSFSVISVLGALPPEIDIDGVEIYDIKKRRELIGSGLISESTPYMTNSDAHYLENVGEKEQVLAENHPLWDMIQKL